MSGTSADAIDVALVDITPTHIKLVDFISQPNHYQKQLSALNNQPTITLSALASLQVTIAQDFAQAAGAMLNKHALKPEAINAIGSHGQTLFHAPELGFSLQVGHPAIIAKKTGIPVAADFRIDDMALGGQGAPLAPAFHQALLQPQQPTLLINIGGIANISYLRPNQPPLGFDSGPGNGLMDELCQTQLACDYDHNGELAASQPPNLALVNQLMQHHYFQQMPPKSTGRETFNQAWLQPQLKTDFSPLELLSSLNQFTVEVLAQDIEKLNCPDHTPCYICGGGAYNQTLLNRLQQRLPTIQVHSTAQLDLNPNAIEAMMCAWLAYNRVHNIETQLMAITGAQRNSVLGGLWLG